MAADTLYGLSLLNGGWQVGGPVDAAWILYYLALGLAALHPSMVSLSEPAPVNPRLTRTHLGLLAGASLMAPAMPKVLRRPSRSGSGWPPTSTTARCRS
jgi:hypothetical protein